MAGSANDDNPRRSSATVDPMLLRKRLGWWALFSSYMLVILFLIGLVQYPVHGLLESSGILDLGPSGGIADIVAVASMLVFLSSFGGLIGWLVGYTVFGKQIAGIIGAILGAIAALCLIQ